MSAARRSRAAPNASTWAVAVIPDCPHLADALREYGMAIAELGIEDNRVEVVVVDTLVAAEARHFTGSPTFLADGTDLFEEEGGIPSLSCRLYETASGLRGTPGSAQILARIRERVAGPT